VLIQRPTNIRAASQRAHALIRLERFDEAQQRFEAMLEFPGAAREYRNIQTESYVRGNIGLIRLQRGELEAGKRDLAQALEIDGNNEAANTALYTVVPEMEAGNLSARGLTHLMSAFEALELGQAVRAQRALRDLTQEAPRFAPAYVILARGLIQESRYAECESVLLIGEQRIPKNVDLKFQRLRCSILRHGVHSPASRSAIDEARALYAAYPDNKMGRQLLSAIDEL
jgi:tetratricopeptide (TPR) repeat protein